MATMLHLEDPSLLLHPMWLRRVAVLLPVKDPQLLAAPAVASRSRFPISFCLVSSSPFPGFVSCPLQWTGLSTVIP
jgi:hypothetical protein